MAKANYVQLGKVIAYSNNSDKDIAYKEIVPLTACVGVAVDNIPQGVTGSLTLEGVHEMPSIATAAFTVGQKLFWDATGGVVTDVDTGTVPCGIAVAPKTASAAVALVKIG